MTSVNLTDISAQDTEDPEGWNYKTLYSIEAVLILGTIITIGCIVVFVTFLKKLKYTLKIILISLCIHNAIGFTIEAIVFGIGFQDEVTCSVMNIMGKSIFVITMEHLALVSFIRHHLSTTTAKNENANITLIVCLVVGDYILEYTMSIIGVLLFTTGYEVSCIGHENLEKDSIWCSVTWVTKAVIILGIGIFYDFQLMSFLKEQNSIAQNGPGEAKLVPWKTNAKEYDFFIPISAGVASGAFAVISFLIVAVLTFGNLTFFSTTLIVASGPTIIMIIQIALTIRAAKLKKSPPPTIERKLNFHDADSEDKEIPQELFHRAQLEEDQFRRDVHSVAGDIIRKQLEDVAEKLSSLDQGYFQSNNAKVIHVEPVRDNQNEEPSEDATEIQGSNEHSLHHTQDIDEMIQEEMELHNN